MNEEYRIKNGNLEYRIQGFSSGALYSKFSIPILNS